jgi:hypothetical protein
MADRDGNDKRKNNSGNPSQEDRAKGGQNSGKGKSDKSKSSKDK